MKNLLLTSILFLFTITTTFADQNCKTQTVKKDYGIGNLKSIILNIGEKIAKKSDETKLEKLVKVLEKIKGTNDKQRGIIKLLKDYFECKTYKDVKKVYTLKNDFVNLHDYDNYNGFEDLITNKIMLNSTSIEQLRNNRNENSYGECSNGFIKVKYFVPPGVDTKLTISVKPLSTFVYFIKYGSANVVDIVNYVGASKPNEETSIDVQVGVGRDVTAYITDYNQMGEYFPNGTWIYLYLAGNTHFIGGDTGSNPEVTLVLALEERIKDVAAFTKWHNNPSNLKNGEPVEASSQMTTYYNNCTDGIIKSITPLSPGVK